MKIRLLLLLVPFILHSCDGNKQKETGDARVTIRIDARVGTEPFEPGVVYTESHGYRYRVETFQTYISMLELVRSDGSSVLVRDFIMATMGSPQTFEVRVPEGDYGSIRFYLGVPAEYNKNVDPTTYPNSHPLSVQGSQGMFWHWNTGYIFTKFDGKADLEGLEGNLLLDPFAFHCGDDPLLRLVELPISSPLIRADSERNFQVHCQVERLLDGEQDQIDIAVDYLTHTQGNFLLARRFMDNFALAFELE